MLIRPATGQDLDGVLQGYEELLKHEEQHGAYTRWKRGVYPTKETAQTSLDEGTLHVLEQDGEICASVILNRVQPMEYASIEWKHEVAPDEALVIHTLCVRPSKSGGGMGRKMVAYAMERARQMGCKVIRLDTSARNRPAVSLYVKLGFDIVSSSRILLDGLIPDDDHLFLEISV